MLKRFLLGCIVTLISCSIQSRTPENLAGTDIFMDITVPSVNEDEASKIISLSNLNLCYGAELFVSGVMQALYNNGDVIRVVKTQGEAGKDVFITCFYKEIVKKEPLLYAEANPLAILTRALFFQTPGTGSIANFKVSELCKVKDKATKIYRPDVTADQWALFVAYVAKKVYEIEQGLGIADHAQVKAQKGVIGKLNDQKLATAIDAFATNSNLGKISFIDLINKCIEYANTNGFGLWFPVRMLMAGVYELFGHDQMLIFSFYAKLQSALQATFAGVDVVKTEVEKIDRPDFLPQPFSKSFLDSSKACIAYNLISELQGVFEPLTYRKVMLETEESFSDCFETMIRNIVLRLIVQPEGSLNVDVLASKFYAFFRTYPDMISQKKQEAYVAWTQLLVDELKGIGWFLRGTCELVPSLNNFLVVLNHIFGLEIDLLNAYNPTMRADTPEAKMMFEQMLNAVNVALRTKLEVPQDVNVIEVDEIDKVVDAPGKMIQGVVHSATGDLAFYMDVSDHCDLEKLKRGKNVTIAPEQLREFPYLVAALKHTQEGLLGNHMIGLLGKSMKFSFLKSLLLKNISECVKRMVYASVAQNFDTDRNEFLGLLKNLVENGQSFEAVASAAGQAMESSGPRVQNFGLYLFKVLFEKGYGFTEAAKAAGYAVKNIRPYVQEGGFKLFKALGQNKPSGEAAGRVAAQKLLDIPEEERNDNVNRVLELYGLNLARHQLSPHEGARQPAEMPG